MKNRLNIKLFNFNQRTPAFPKFDSSALSFSKYFSLSDHSSFPEPELEESYFCNVENKADISRNISNRKGVGDIEKVIELSIKNGTIVKAENNINRNLLIKEMMKIPNRTHPDVIKYGEIPLTVKLIGEKKSFTSKLDVFHNLTKSINLLRNDTSNFTGHRSYFFCGQLAELESAMIKYSVHKLVTNGFQLISVPDILHRSVIEGCGMETHGKRSQVYSLSTEHHGGDKCLSGTSEMALAGYLINKKLSVDQLPLRLAAVSRCYRAETSRTSEERGIYRVHQFTKVEMFGVCEPDKSEKLLEEFRDFQEGHFASLGLHLRVLDMPAHELGAQAYRKYDLEAWLPAKEMWAEVSSCSDCTDYQSRRLLIKREHDGAHLHTVNGTACAVPRLVIALFETHQQPDGSVLIPGPLQRFMGGATSIGKSHARNIPKLKLIKRQSDVISKGKLI